eukprot:1161621-Pelagomonas_calceolata.AAC.4
MPRLGGEWAYVQVPGAPFRSKCVKCDCARAPSDLYSVEAGCSYSTACSVSGRHGFGKPACLTSHAIKGHNSGLVLAERVPPWIPKSLPQPLISPMLLNGKASGQLCEDRFRLRVCLALGLPPWPPLKEIKASKVV